MSSATCRRCRPAPVASGAPHFEPRRPCASRAAAPRRAGALAAVVLELRPAQRHLALAAPDDAASGPARHGDADQRFLARRAFFVGMPKILLPLPRGSSGSSAAGNTSSRPSLFTRREQRVRPPGTGAGGSTCAPSGTFSTALPARLRRVQLLQLHDEAVARVVASSQQVLAARRSARRRTSRRPADRAGRTAARPGRAPTAACAPAGCRRGRCCRGTPPAGCCGRAPRRRNSSPVL